MRPRGVRKSSLRTNEALPLGSQPRFARRTLLLFCGWTSCRPCSRPSPSRMTRTHQSVAGMPHDKKGHLQGEPGRGDEEGETTAEPSKRRRRTEAIYCRGEKARRAVPHRGLYYFGARERVRSQRSATSETHARHDRGRATSSRAACQSARRTAGSSAGPDHIMIYAPPCPRKMLRHEKGGGRMVECRPPGGGRRVGGRRASLVTDLGLVTGLDRLDGLAGVAGLALDPPDTCGLVAG